MTKVYDAFGPVPASVAPSTKVRRWDQGLIAGGAAFSALWAGGLAVGLSAPGPDLGSYTHHLTGALATAFHYATAGISLREAAAAYVDSIQHPVSVLLRVGTPLALALAGSVAVMRHALKPRSNVWHLSGPRLLEGKEAVQEAKRRSLTRKQREADPFHLALHPDLVLPKKHWSRHGFIYGSVGSGKTQVMLPVIRQLLEKDAKLFLYDVKGDFSSMGDFGTGHRPIIVSPFDRRSYVWDVARDVRTPTQAAAFAASLIPEEGGGSNKFWTIAAQQLLTGAVRFLQNTKGMKWSWSDLARAVAQGAEEMLPMLQQHYARAAPLIANPDSQTTASLLSTLAGYTRVIDDLALAWPRRSKRSFSITDWCKDDYPGRKQVIVQAGGDAQLTKAYIAAMVNVAVPTIISPALPENEEGRCLAFILDELPSIGRININPLIDRGRSKGVVFLGGLQDMAQLREVYGENVAKAMAAMVGTHIICQVQAGETRDEVSRLLGKRRVAWMNHGDKAVVHEEGRAVVSADKLTDELGFRKGASMGPLKWGIRAIVYTGGNPLLLNFPGTVIPAVRAAQEPAIWTTGPAGAMSPPPSRPAPVEKPQEARGIGLTMEDLEKEMERIYRD